MEAAALLDQISRIKSLHAGTQPLFKEFIKNKEYLLEERWKFFCEYGEFILEIDVCNPEVLGLSHILEDLQIHKHQTVSFEYIIDLLEQYQEDGHHKELDINNLKEIILEQGLANFIYDW